MNDLSCFVRVFQSVRDVEDVPWIEVERRRRFESSVTHPASGGNLSICGRRLESVYRPGDDFFLLKLTNHGVPPFKLTNQRVLTVGTYQWMTRTIATDQSRRIAFRTDQSEGSTIGTDQWMACTIETDQSRESHDLGPFRATQIWNGFSSCISG